MSFPFNEQVELVLLNAMADDSGDSTMLDPVQEFVQEKVLDYLNGLSPGKKVSPNPLIRVKAVDETSVTFLLRGRMSFLKGGVQPFVRIEARFSKTQIGLEEISTFIAELYMKSPSGHVEVTEVRMALGYDGLTFMGRGMAKVIPIGLGVDVFIGGVNSDGIMLGLFADFPAPVPLGPIPFGLKGIGGEYAHNFKPRIESGLTAEDPKIDLETGETPSPEIPDLIENPTAVHYVQWARNPDAPDRWIAADPQERARAVGIKASFTDTFSNGAMLDLKRFGLSVMVPGPTIILGGDGSILNGSGPLEDIMEEISTINFQGYAVVDVPSKSFSLGGAFEMKFVRIELLEVLEAKGPMDTYFSFADPRAWFARIGSELAPAKMTFMKIYDAKFNFELNHFRIQAGLEIIWKKSLEMKVKKSILELYAKLSVGARAMVGWNPWQIAAEMTLGGEAGIKILKLTFAISLSTKVTGHFPQPKFLKASFDAKLNLQWPLPDIKITFKAPEEEDKKNPQIENPYRQDLSPDVHHGALHPISGRQWNLNAPSENPLDLPWPDSILVVSFSDQLKDLTGIIRSTEPAPDTVIHGGYEVSHVLDALQIVDLETGEAIPNLHAHWGATDQSDTAQLHILSPDPYAWLTSTASMSASISRVAPQTKVQTFGNGEEETFSQERRFGDLYIAPKTSATLSNAYETFLGIRTLDGQNIHLNFKQSGGSPIRIDRLHIYAIEYHQFSPTFIEPNISVIQGSPLNLHAVAPLTEILENLYLVEYEVESGNDLDLSQCQIESLTGFDFHLYAIKYRVKEVTTSTCTDQVILAPGNYQLQMQGRTNASSLHEMPNPEEETWQMEHEFEVIYPPTLRPYLQYVTIGDSRQFGDFDFADNPTSFGLGFPAYRQYLPVMRTRVPYLGAIYPNISFRLQYEEDSDPALKIPLTPQANPDGENSLLEVSEDYQQSFGCPVAPDDELEVPASLPKAGDAEIGIWFQPPGQDARRIDTWDCIVSQFLDFADHLHSTQNRLTRIYTSSGPESLSRCLGIGSLTTHEPEEENELPLAGRRNSSGNSGAVDGFGALVFPNELDQAPPAWRLPNELSQVMGQPNVPQPIRYGRFAQASGIRFGESDEDILTGINEPNPLTWVEALVDQQGRLLALWLRTPEPLDWRRVNADLTIRHFSGEEECDTDLAFRRPLNLGVEIIPAPDASSAFLVGRFNGTRIRLPRGRFELDLSFDPNQSNLPRLRPGQVVSGNPEQVTLTFDQGSGLNWPQP